MRERMFVSNRIILPPGECKSTLESHQMRQLEPYTAPSPRKYLHPALATEYPLIPRPQQWPRVSRHRSWQCRRRFRILTLSTHELSSLASLSFPIIAENSRDSLSKPIYYVHR